jgi:hypothetical protein
MNLAKLIVQTNSALELISSVFSVGNAGFRAVFLLSL